MSRPLGAKLQKFTYRDADPGWLARFVPRGSEPRPSGSGVPGFPQLSTKPSKSKCCVGNGPLVGVRGSSRGSAPPASSSGASSRSNADVTSCRKPRGPCRHREKGTFGPRKRIGFGFIPVATTRGDGSWSRPWVRFWMHPVSGTPTRARASGWPNRAWDSRRRRKRRG